MKEWILSLVGVISVLLGIIGTLFVEKIKNKKTEMKSLRILALDCGVTMDSLKKLQKTFQSNPLFSNLTIFIDRPLDPCLYHYDKSKKLITKKKAKNIKNYGKGEKKIECWKYKDLSEKIANMNRIANIGVLAITTFPLASENYAGINSGTWEIFKMKKLKERKRLEKLSDRFKGSNIKMAILPYKKGFLKNKFKTVIGVAEHEVAHLLKIDNYNFICGEFQSP